jgi:23S rRNA-/tRNA-specific pseudouridylate synthase
MKNETPRIISREEDALILYKPTGWSVHPAGPDTGPTITEWLSENEKEPVVPLHRLDKGTSGILVASAKKEERSALSIWFEKREVHKEYLALVHGRIRRKGVIRRPLQDARRGKPLAAVTRYKLVEWLGSFSLVQLTMETGRKHQIRRHLQGLGHGVVGDRRYRTPRTKLMDSRLCLHAAFLAFPDERSWDSPIPDDFREILLKLKPDEPQE